MQKTILFLASELPLKDAIPAKCNDLCKAIEAIIKAKQSDDFYRIRKLDQPTGSELISRIEDSPEYIHYCGHGGVDGAFKLLDEDGQPYSFDVGQLATSLERNNRLECLFLGSCNSDKLVEKLQLYADYSIGFQNKPSPDWVIMFYKTYYAYLFEHGSPFEAFLKTRNHLISNKTKTAGAQAIIRTKNNYIMKLIASSQQILHEKVTIGDIDLSIAAHRKKLLELEGEAFSLFDKLLSEHPFPLEVFWFYTAKEKLSHDIAKKVKYTSSPDEVQFFAERLFMAFEILEKVLVAFEERKESKKIFSWVLKGQTKSDFINAFKLLEKNNEVQKLPKDFQVLFSESIQYAIGIF